MKKIIKGKDKINSAGTHEKCKTKNIEYGISNGSFWYYCHKCKKSIKREEISA